MSVSPRVWPRLLLLVGLLAYANSLGGPFIFDDQAAIVDNPKLHRLWPVWEAMRPPPNTAVAGRPVVNLTLALNYAASGLAVGSYHLFNLALHLFNGLLLYGLLRRTLTGSVHRTGPLPAAAAVYRADGLAVLVALLWLVHPLQTESVTYVIQRTELLVGLCLLTTIYCVARAAAPGSANGWRWLAILASATGMGCKEVMVVAPLLALGYDRVFLSDSWPGLWRARGRLHLALAGTWLILLVLLAGGPRERSAGWWFADLTAVDYALTQCAVIFHYLRLAVWPVPLVLDYADWPVTRTLAGALPAVLGIGLLVAATVAACWLRPTWGYLGLWFFLILAPTSSFLPIRTEMVAERRMYLPLVAVISLVVVGLHGALALVGHRCRWRGPWPDRLVTILVAIVVPALIWATVRRNDDYRSARVIWSDTVEKRPANARARTNLGNALLAAGELAAAVEQYAQAVRLDPALPEAQNNLGVGLRRQGHWDEAARRFAAAIRLKPDYQAAYANLADARARQGDWPRAERLYREVIRRRPESAEAHHWLGYVLAQQQRYAEAVPEYQSALPGLPTDADLHSNLAIALAALGRREAALHHFREAARLQPDDVEIRDNLRLFLAGPAPGPARPGR